MAKTREQFESTYNSGNIMPLIIRGRLSLECYCTEDMCEGWKLTHIEWLYDDVCLYGNTSSEVSVALRHRVNLMNSHILSEGKQICQSSV